MGKSESKSSNTRPYLPFKNEYTVAMPRGLRLIQALYGIIFLVVLCNAALMSPDSFIYEESLMSTTILASTSILVMWLIEIRWKWTRPLVIFIAAFNIALSVNDLFISGGFAILTERVPFLALICLTTALYASLVITIVYLAVSPRVKEVLSHDYDYESPRGHTWELPLGKRLRTWEFWRDLAIYFIVFSFLGHWAEMAFCQLIRLGLVMGDYDPSNAMLWDQWLYPFSAEGIALVLIVLVLHPLSRWFLEKTKHIVPALILSLVVTAIVCVGIDFTLGITTNADYHLWDYRNLPFNFMGQVCLQNSVVYTTAAMLIVWVFYPLMDKLIRAFPKILVDGVFWYLAGFYAFSALLHFMYLSPAGFVFG